MQNLYTPSDALLVVDVQNDFCPGGALPIPDGDEVVPVLNRWLEAAAADDVPIYVSRDWHPAGHPSFSEQGGDWPPHCLQDSDGAAFHPDLAVPPAAVVVTKGTRFDQDQYSAFDQTGLAARLEQDGVERVWLGGLAEDVCVRATALDARHHGFEVMMVPDGTRPAAAKSAREARREMCDAGVEGI